MKKYVDFFGLLEVNLCWRHSRHIYIIWLNRLFYSISSSKFHQFIFTLESSNRLTHTKNKKNPMNKNSLHIRIKIDRLAKRLSVHQSSGIQFRSLCHILLLLLVVMILKKKKKWTWKEKHKSPHEYSIRIHLLGYFYDWCVPAMPFVAQFMERDTNVLNVYGNRKWSWWRRGEGGVEACGTERKIANRLIVDDIIEMNINSLNVVHLCFAYVPHWERFTSDYY